MGDYYYGPTAGLVAKRRSEVLPGETIVGRAPRYDQQLIPYDDRPRIPYGDRPRIPYDDRRSLARRSDRGRDRDVAYDSESSIAPRPSRGRAPRAKSQDNKDDKDNKERSSSVSTSDLGSTTDDEKKIKKMKRRKYFTFAITGVAAIHAGGSIHKAMEIRKQNKADVKAGEMTTEEAHEKARKQKWQEASAVGLSALGLYQSWQEVKEARELHGEHLELLEKKAERHVKREMRRKAGRPCRIPHPDEGNHDE